MAYTLDDLRKEKNTIIKPSSTNTQNYGIEQLRKEKQSLQPTTPAEQPKSVLYTPKKEPVIKPPIVKPSITKTPYKEPARPSQVPSNVQAPTFDTMGVGMQSKTVKFPGNMYKEQSPLLKNVSADKPFGDKSNEQAISNFLRDEEAKTGKRPVMDLEAKRGTKITGGKKVIVDAAKNASQVLVNAGNTIDPFKEPKLVMYKSRSRDGSYVMMPAYVRAETKDKVSLYDQFGNEVNGSAEKSDIFDIKSPVQKKQAEIWMENQRKERGMAAQKAQEEFQNKSLGQQALDKFSARVRTTFGGGKDLGSSRQEINSANFETTGPKVLGVDVVGGATDIAGSLAGFAGPGTQGTNLLSASNQIGRTAMQKIVPQAIQKQATKKVIGQGVEGVKALGARTLTGAVEGAGTMPLLTVYNGIAQGKNPKDILKDIPKEMQTGAIFGAAANNAIPILRIIGNKIIPKSFKKVQDTYNAPIENLNPNEAITFEPIVNKVVPKSQGKYTVKNEAWEQAVNDYNNAIELVHNRFKTNQFRANERPVIDEYLRSQGYELDEIVKRMAASEKLTGKEILNQKAEIGKYKRVAGLGSDKSVKVIETASKMEKIKPKKTRPTLGDIQRRMFGDDFIERNIGQVERNSKLSQLEAKYKEDIAVIKNSNLNPQEKASRLKTIGFKYSADKRAIIQGSSAKPVEGGLTPKELQSKQVKENSNYYNKSVIVDGKQATVVSTPYGKVKVKFEDGTYKTVPKEQVGTPVKTVNNTEISQEIVPNIKQPSANVKPLEQGKSRFAQQVKYNSTLPKEYKQKAVTPDYEIVKDETAWSHAKSKLKDPESATNEILSKTDAVGKNDIATGVALIEKYAAEGKHDIANSLLNKITLDLTNAGQTIQAAKLLSKNTPEGMVKYAQTEIRRAVEKIVSPREKELLKTIDDLQAKIDGLNAKKTVLEKKPRTANVIKELAELNNSLKVNLQLFAEKELKLPASLKNAQLTNANKTYIRNKQNEIKGISDPKLRLRETARLTKYIAEKIPVTVARKIATVQTLAQLLNPKTSMRNIVGNTGFAALENVSQVVARPIDKAIGLITKQRTNKYGFDVAAKQGKGFVKGLKEGYKDAIEGIDTAPGVQSQYDLPSTKAFKGEYGKAIDYIKRGNLLKGTAEMASASIGKLETGLSITLRTPDRAFYQAAFNRSVKNQMKANKITEVSKVTDEMLQVAHQDGLYATFQDTNLLSKAFVKMKSGLNKIGIKGEFGLGDLILKYPKTPANIIMRAIDYSPAGILKAAYQIRNGLKTNQKDIVESLSRAAVGTGITALAGWMYQLGIITGKRPKSQQAADLLKESGQGQYNFNKSAFMRWLSSGLDPESARAKDGDTTFNYDWFQPSAVNVATGANIMQQNKDKSKVNPLDVFQAVVYSMQASTDTLAEQPLVQGVSKMFQYGNISDNLSNTIASAPASFIPTFVNQVKQLTDNKSRIVESNDKNLINATAQKAINLVKNKIPGLSKTLPERYTTTGNVRETYQNGGNNWANVFFNPAFVSTFKTTPGTKTILDIYGRTGDTKQFYKEAPDYITINGRRLTLNQEQKNELQQIIGKQAVEELNKLAENSKFNAATDDQKIEIIGNILDKVGTYGRNYLLKKLGKDYVVNNLDK